MVTEISGNPTFIMTSANSVGFCLSSPIAEDTESQADTAPEQTE